MKRLGLFVLSGLLWSCLGTSGGSSANTEPVTITRTIKINNFEQGWNAIDRWHKLTFKDGKSFDYMNKKERLAKDSNALGDFRYTEDYFALKTHWDFKLNSTFKIADGQIHIIFDSIEYEKFLSGSSRSYKTYSLLNNNKSGLKAINAIADSVAENIKKELN